jgi:hypothetical protein
MTPTHPAGTWLEETLARAIQQERMANHRVWPTDESHARAIIATPAGQSLAARVAALEAVVSRTASMGLCSQTHHEHLMRDALAVRGGATPAP